MDRKQASIVKKLCSALVITGLLCYFMGKSASPKVIFLPFLWCSLSMVGKCIAQLTNRKKLADLFGKLFVVGFLLFLVGFLVFAGIHAVREERPLLLVVSVPFWLVGFHLFKNRLIDKKREKGGASALTFALVISGVLVFVALAAGILLLVLGIQRNEAGMLFGGGFFVAVSLAFVLVGCTALGCFDKIKADVLGMYAGGVLAAVGIGIFLLQWHELGTFPEALRAFRAWILIPILLVGVGIYQILRCIRKKNQV